MSGLVVGEVSQTRGLDVDAPLRCHGGTAAAARAVVKDAIRRARAMAAASPCRVRPGTPTIVPKKAIRLRPKARDSFAYRPPFEIPIAARTGSLWNCREASRHYWQDGMDPPRTNGTRGLTMEEAAIMRAFLIDAQDGLCGLCGRPISMADIASPTHHPSFDHVIPRSAGGGETDNLIIAHNQCNSNKANDLPTGCELVWLFVIIAKTPVHTPSHNQGTPDHG